MITITGESVWPDDITEYHGVPVDNHIAPSLYAIGVGLGRTARFAGQTREYYTVLAHTLTVAELVAPEHRLLALLHDAPEAIVGDTPTTWKTDEAKRRERLLLARISVSVGVDAWTDEEWVELKRADEITLAAEAHALGHAEADLWWPRELWCGEKVTRRDHDDFNRARAATIRHLQHVTAWLRAPAAGAIYTAAVKSALQNRAQHNTTQDNT